MIRALTQKLMNLKEPSLSDKQENGINGTGIIQTSVTSSCDESCVDSSDHVVEVKSCSGLRDLHKVWIGSGDVSYSKELDAVFERIETLFPEDDAGMLPEDFPTFRREELMTGLHLGQGCFSDVFEVKQVQDKETVWEHSKSRAFFSSRCLTCYGETRYALKTLREDIRRDPCKAWLDFADLVIETRLLSKLVHPNIIKLRAIADSSTASPEYFIVLDRLYDTPSARIKKWKRKEQPFCALPLVRKNKSLQKVALWEKRLTYAFHLASALAYMHEQRVIHRDLKPDNIGFDINNEIKLFDLGLSTPIRSTSEVYHLSMAGSLRYMAPEVFRGEPYNQGCDVYSFSLLLWEMLTLERPYDNFRSTKELQMRVLEQGRRPKIPRHWSQPLREILSAGWEHDQFERVGMTTLRSFLGAATASQFHQDEDDPLGCHRRRSTHVYNFQAKKRHLVRMPSKEEILKAMSEISLDDDDSSVLLSVKK